MADISSDITALKEAIYGKEVRGALVSLAEGFNDRIGGGLYIAVYGKTSYEDILAAYNAGKMVLAERNGICFKMTISPAQNAGRVSFTGVVSSSTIQTVNCSYASAWSYSYAVLATQSWVNSKIDAAIGSAITAAIEGSY